MEHKMRKKIWAISESTIEINAVLTPIVLKKIKFLKNKQNVLKTLLL